jgi:hypothetical protein
MAKSFIFILSLSGLIGLATASLAEVNPQQKNVSPVLSYLVDDNREFQPGSSNKPDLKSINYVDSLRNTVTLCWNEIKTFYQAATQGETDSDNVRPAPIPASALLLCFGLIGLIGFGFRRRYNKGNR